MFFCLTILCFTKPVDKIEKLVGPLTSDHQAWLLEHPHTRNALTNIAEKHLWTDQQQASAIFDYFTTEADPILSVSQTAQEVAILKVLHPDWSLARLVFTAAWNVTKGQTHSVLDLVGLVPGLGEGADFVNGVFYLLEGEKANAAFSFSAMVPFLGWTSTGAKYAGKIVKTLAGRTTELKYIVNSNGFITFGKSSQLARVIGKKANHQAHHIIPWSKNDHLLIQKAADSGDYHPNMALNGILLDRAIHEGYDKAHRRYNKVVEKALNDLLIASGPTVSPQKAAQQLEFLTSQIRKQLLQGKKLDEITL